MKILIVDETQAHIHNLEMRIQYGLEPPLHAEIYNSDRARLQFQWPDSILTGTSGRSISRFGPIFKAWFFKNKPRTFHVIKLHLFKHEKKTNLLPPSIRRTPKFTERWIADGGSSPATSAP